MEKRKNITIIGINIVAVIVVFFLIILFLFSAILPFVTRQNSTIIVPSLVGMTIDDAKNVAEKIGLQCSISENKSYSTKVGIGKILEQYPHANTTVKPERIIYLTINSGEPPLVCLPLLVDKSIRNAYSVTKSLNLKIGKIEYVNDIADNVVIDVLYNGRSLKDQSKLHNGDSIDLIVGVSNDYVFVPKLVGLSKDKLELILLENKLKIGSITYVRADGINDDIVISQDPDCETSIKCGSAINVQICSNDNEEEE